MILFTFLVGVAAIAMWKRLNVEDKIILIFILGFFCGIISK